MTAPIFIELTEGYSGRQEGVFIGEWKKPGSGAKRCRRSLLRTFNDVTGRERFRHHFHSKKDILQKWSELGVQPAAKQPTAPAC